MRRQTEMYQRYEVGTILMVPDNTTYGYQLIERVSRSGKVVRLYKRVDNPDLNDSRIIMLDPKFSS